MPDPRSAASGCRTTCVCTIGKTRTLQFSNLPDGGLGLSFEAPTGLCQLSVIADAREFDWEELYVNVNDYSNTGQRTGPWDFKLGPNHPLVPSYWVHLNGRRIGLWYFERVSLEDVEANRFRGRVAFHVANPGPQELALLPYRPFSVRWNSALLEPDPADVLEPIAADLSDWPARCPAAAWGEESFWQQRREELDTSHARFRAPLSRAFDWVLAKEQPGADDFMLLLAAHHLEGRAHALERALETVDRFVALPHWGHQREDAYGHNGDMGASGILRPLAWAVHALRDQLGESRRERLLAKLALQGERFFENALLTRDYWGGSLVQDHGWKSMFGFGTAVLHLLGTLPEAERWAAYIVPRLRRSVAAIPTDGVIPPSSYCSLFLYLNEPTQYRDTLLALTGHDTFDDAPFAKVVDYVAAILREEDHAMLAATPFANPVIPFVGGNAFLNRIAAKERDRTAARLQQILLDTPSFHFFHPTQQQAFYHDAFWGFLTFDPEIEPAAQLPETGPLRVFRDSGFVHYRDRKSDVTLTLRCGPFASHTGYRRARGPCDRLGGPPGAGHFVLAVGARPLLTTPDSGYRLHSFLRTCLLVDGKGQWGDVGYPMSIPSCRHRDYEVEAAHWDADAGAGRVGLDLTGAYPEELGMSHYSRDFLIAEGNSIVCRDHVVFDEPHELSWLFQVSEADGIRQEEGLRYRVGASPALRIMPQPVGVDLTGSVHKTEVVWSYSSSSGFKPFIHLRYDSTTATATAIVDFVITWPHA